MGFDASLGRRLGLTRIGIHHVRLLPGRRTSYPHAEGANIGLGTIALYAQLSCLGLDQPIVR